MKATTERAWAKLNLSLDVLGKRPDGFHDLRMVMQTASLCDEVYVELTDGPCRAETNLRYVPGDERNIAVKAARAFFEAAGIKDRGAFIRLKKRIPVCAGLGGGSSDAAAVFRALNRLTGAGLSEDELRQMALTTGSDVPFCISGGTALAEGRGEVLTDLPPLPDCAFVICMPGFSVSTPELFGRIDARTSRCRPDTDGLLGAIGDGSLPGAARRMYNVFEDVLETRAGKAVRELKSALLDEGALGAVMSGTGSAVYGAFPDAAAARAAIPKLEPLCKTVHFAESVGKIEI